MVTYIIYNQGTEGEQKSTYLGSELEKRKVRYELIDADSARGIAIAEMYDVLARPAVVLAGPDGSMIQKWDQYWPGAPDIAYQYFV